MEGSATDEQITHFTSLIQNKDVKSIAEIGFNAGVSSCAFLEASPEVQVISFDTGEHVYVQDAKKYIDATFPGRHTLLLGNSKTTVPKFAKDHSSTSFDLIFIDGGHDFETAKADLINMKKLATPNTILIFDDLTPWHSWGIGPTKAWLEALQSGLVIQEELFKDGKVVDAIEPPGKRSWGVGKYLF